MPNIARQERLLMIRKSLSQGDFIDKVITYSFSKTGYSNRAIGALERRWKNYRRLEKRYSKTIPSLRAEGVGVRPKEENIWVCWLQGENNAPELVKRCIASMRYHMPERELVIVSAENIADYVTLPDFIMRKWQSGAISNTHFSDILRNQLLIEHGGLWLDSTVLLTGPLPSYVDDGSLFMFRHMNQDDICISYNSWLIYSYRGNGTLKTLQALLFKYWEENDSLADYFLWHLLLTMVLGCDSSVEESILPVTDDLSEQLSLMLFRPFSADLWRHALGLTTVHKLSNKYPEELRRLPGTLYRHLELDIPGYGGMHE